MKPLTSIQLRDKFAERMIRQGLDNLSQPLSAAVSLDSWRRFSLSSGISRSQIQSLFGHLETWINGGSSFDQANADIRSFVEICLESRMKTRELFALRQVLSSFGFFCSSAPLLQRGAQLISSQRGLITSARDLRRHLRASLLLGDLDTYFDQLSVLHAKIGRESTTDRKLLYFGALLKAPRYEFGIPEVIVIGPSEVDEKALTRFSTASRARILIPSKFPKGNSFGRDHPTTVLYANGETTDWLATLSAEQRSQLVSSGVTLRLKKSLPSEALIPNAEKIIRSRDLFLTGNPNLVPMAIFDLLLRGFTRIYVTGANFWFGKVAYRESQRRFRPELNAVTDSFGSLGGEFERCIGLASHDQIANRRLVKTFVAANLVSGDQGFLDSMNVGECEYLLHLDSEYGRHRR